ncbi:MAG: alpha/beta fold hydrolase [Paenibacillaceae bacterium]|jgi:pimeloyl-ACP methyl ester carboxylesterase|nr:alpha/beta fold hydrolase [Paenibacillaceae bacterium]
MKTPYAFSQAHPVAPYPYSYPYPRSHPNSYPYRHSHPYPYPHSLPDSYPYTIAPAWTSAPVPEPCPAHSPVLYGANTGWCETIRPLTFVLVHGAWADACFWNGIAAKLCRMGHTVYIPEYPGHGPDPNKDVTHDMISRSVADFITSRNLCHVVLVGHSFGGTVIQKTAELVPDRIRRLVFQNAFVLEDGQSAADEFPPATRQAFEQLLRSSKDNTIMLPFPVFRDMFVNLASLELAKELYSTITPEPGKPLFEKLDLKKFYSLNIPKSYVYLTEDNVMPQGNSRYGWFPHMAERLGMFRLIKGHGDHMTNARTEPCMVARKIYEGSRD